MRALYEMVYDRLVDDDGLSYLTGGTNIYPEQGPRDAPFPYLVQSVTASETNAPWPMRQGRLEIHLWDEAATIERIMGMRDRVVALLDNWQSNSDDLGGVRAWLASESAIPDENHIRHYVIQFNVRLYRVADAEAILAMEGN